MQKKATKKLSTFNHLWIELRGESKPSIRQTTQSRAERHSVGGKVRKLPSRKHRENINADNTRQMKLKRERRQDTTNAGRNARQPPIAVSGKRIFTPTSRERRGRWNSTANACATPQTQAERCGNLLAVQRKRELSRNTLTWVTSDGYRAHRSQKHHCYLCHRCNYIAVISQQKTIMNRPMKRHADSYKRSESGTRLT